MVRLFHSTLLVTVTTLALSSCASTSSSGGSSDRAFRLSSDGYATQTRAPRSDEKETDWIPLDLPKHIGSGDAVTAVDQYMNFIFQTVPQAYEAGYDARRDIYEVGVGLTREEFEATVPPDYKNASNIEWTLLPDSMSDAPVSDELAPYIRAFEVSPGYSGIVLTSLTRNYLRLEDGCIYMGKRGRETAVMLRREAGLRIDDDGYVVIYSRMWPEDQGVRLGQEMGWGDGTRDVSDTPGGERLISACGASSAVAIGMPSPYPFRD